MSTRRKGKRSRRRTERSESAATSGKPSGARAPPKLLRVLRKFACGALRHGRAPGAQGLRRAFWRRKPRPPTEKDAVGGKGVAQTSAAAQSPHRFPCSADTLPCRFSHSRHGENNAHPSAPLRGGKNPRAMNPVSRTSVIKKQVRQRHAAERQAKPAANRAERERRHKRKAERSESAAEAAAGFKKICLRRFAPWARPGRAGFAARLLAKKAPTADRKRRGWRKRGCSNFCRRPKPAPLSMFGGHPAVPLFSQPTR